MLGKRRAFVPNRNHGGRVWGWVEAGRGSPAVLFLLVRATEFGLDIAQ